MLKSQPMTRKTLSLQQWLMSPLLELLEITKSTIQTFSIQTQVPFTSKDYLTTFTLKLVTLMLLTFRDSNLPMILKLESISSLLKLKSILEECFSKQRKAKLEQKELIMSTKLRKAVPTSFHLFLDSIIQVSLTTRPFLLMPQDQDTHPLSYSILNTTPIMPMVSLLPEP